MEKDAMDFISIVNSSNSRDLLAVAHILLTEILVRMKAQDDLEKAKEQVKKEGGTSV